LGRREETALTQVLDGVLILEAVLFDSGAGKAMLY